MAQTGVLKEIDNALRGEYTVRRRMLIERAKVTLQSFLWAEKIQKSEDLKQPAQAAAQQGEALMHNQPAVTLDDVFRAKQGAGFGTPYCLCLSLPSTTKPVKVLYWCLHFPDLSFFPARVVSTHGCEHCCCTKAMAELCNRCTGQTT